MDPLTHTLVGASFAATGLKQKTALATATLIIAANLPDIDGVCLMMGTDAGLAGRRGHTHGVVALLLLPLALAATMFMLAKWLERRRPSSQIAGQPILSFRWLLLLSALGVASHPLLDWMNNYGVRVLMPFSPTWFYGDALFIIDPLVWLLAGAAVVFTWGRTKLAALGWILLLLAATAVVVVPKLTPPQAKMLWCVGAGLLVYLRVREKSPPPKPTAIVCLSLLVLYIGAMVWGTNHARNHASAWLRANGMPSEQVMVSPLPAQPLQREVIAVVGNSYHYFVVPAFGNQPPRPSHPPLPLGQRTAAVQAALAAPHVQGFVNWMRLPAFEQRTTTTGFQVTILDARYAHAPTTRLRSAQVDLDHNLRVITPGS